MKTYKIRKDLSITEKTLEQWSDVLVPHYDFFYFESPDEPMELLSPEVLVYSREELQNDKQLSNLNVTSAFTPWNVDKKAQYVAVVPNIHFQTVPKENRMKILYEQWRLGRWQIWELTWVMTVLEEIDSDIREKALEVMEQNIFETPNGKMVANQRIIWNALPKEARTALLIAIAKTFADDPSLWSELPEAERKRLSANHQGIVKHFNTYSGTNGANCFATALAGATKDNSSGEWVIEQWIQPKETFLLCLSQRGYEKVHEYTTERVNDIQERDILVWVNKEGVPLHACYSLGNGLVFNKNSQMMYSPRQITYENDILRDWSSVIDEGGALNIYRLKG